MGTASTSVDGFCITWNTCVGRIVRLLPQGQHPRGRVTVGVGPECCKARDKTTD